MKLKAFSQEWAETYKEKINKNDEYKKLASNWNDSIILETEQDGKNIGVLLVLENGSCKRAKSANDIDYETATYVIHAKVNIWQDLLDGIKDPVMAIMQKNLVLSKGSLTNLLKYVNAAKELLKTAKQIETYF